MGAAASPAKVNVWLGGQAYDGDLEAETRFDPTDPEAVSRALADNPGRYAWWAALAVRARRLVEELENRKAVLYAELFTKYSAVAGPKAPTVEATKAFVTSDGEYAKALAALAEAREQHGLALVAAEAFEKRQEALVEAARHLRKELDAGMRDHLREIRDRYERSREGRQE